MIMNVKTYFDLIFNDILMAEEIGISCSALTLFKWIADAAASHAWISISHFIWKSLIEQIEMSNYTFSEFIRNWINFAIAKYLKYRISLWIVENGIFVHLTKFYSIIKWKFSRIPSAEIGPNSILSRRKPNPC